MGNQIDSSVIEEHPIIESRVSVYWEIWVLYVDGSREKLGTFYRHEFKYDAMEMLRANQSTNVREFFSIAVAK